MQSTILDFLKKKQGYVSGDAISKYLGVSRQALWKHIQELKDAGYDIVAVPHLGYQLIAAPDKLLPDEIARGLSTKTIGARAYYYDSVSSTMDEGMRMGFEGAPEGTLVVAEAQTKGRGRLGREWSSQKAKGIYASLILRPKIMPTQASRLTLLTAVSLCEAIQASTGLEPRIKWPNDILIGAKKCAGILTELNAETDTINFVVIGFGINVNNDRKSLLATATSLMESKKEFINRVALLQEVLRRYEDNYALFTADGFGPISEKWRAYNITLGQRVKVSCQSRQIEGEALDIDADGALLVRADSGLTERVTAGDVVHCR